VLKRKKNTARIQVLSDCYGHQAWQYQPTKELVNGKPLYGLKKKVGDVYKMLLPNCSKIIPPVGNFIEYNATHIELDDGLALINERGKILFRSLKSVAYISDKLIAIDKDGSEKYRLYNPYTCRLTKEAYSDFEVYDNYIKTFDGDFTGILNWDFQEELPAEYSEVFPFGNVYKGITPSGKEVLGSARWGRTSAEAEKIFPEANGFFRAYDVRYGYIRADNGRNLIQFMFEQATDFESNGLAHVKIALNHWKYLDANGKTLQPPGEGIIL